MKKIVALSDTHIPKVGNELPPALLRAAQEADLILHAGDLVDLPVLDELRRLAPVAAVAGNMDYPAVKAALPEERVVEVEGRLVALTHGWGPPLGIERRVLSRFSGVDVVVFGHTHAALVEERKGVLLVNPGTPNDRRFSSRLSYAVITVDGGNVSAELVWLD